MKARRAKSTALIPSTPASSSLPEKKPAGWSGAVRNKRVKNILQRMAQMEYDTMDLIPEANLLRAMTIDYINRYEEFTEALMAWYADPDTHVKPRRIMDITDAASLVESISRVVHRVHQIQSEGSISMETFKRVTENMGLIVARYVKDPLVLNQIEYEWVNLSMDGKKPPEPPETKTVDVVDAVPPKEQNAYGQESNEGARPRGARQSKQGNHRRSNEAVSPGAESAGDPQHAQPGSDQGGAAAAGGPGR